MLHRGGARPLVPRPGWSTRWAAVLLALPLVLALAATGTWAMQLRAEADERGEQANSFGAALEQALAGDGTEYRLFPGPAAPGARGWIVTDDRHETATFFMKHPEAHAGERYQLLVNRGGEQQVLAEVKLDGRGRGLVTFALDQSLVESRQVRVKAKVPAGDTAATGGPGMALWGRIAEATEPEGNDPPIGALE